MFDCTSSRINTRDVQGCLIQTILPAIYPIHNTSSGLEDSLTKTVGMALTSIEVRDPVEPVSLVSGSHGKDSCVNLASTDGAVCLFL